MSDTKFKAAKYIRLSYADDKDGESNSVENQRKQLDSFIATQPDIETVSEMVDDGYSGILFDRPAFKAMMTEIENGRINCVIVKDLSRLGREYIETGRYLRRIFPAYGVRFIAINDNIDTIKDCADDLVISVKSIINDSYSRDISVKTRTALNIKRENGDYVGACPIYGYKRSEGNKNQLAIDDYPASIVRDIFRMKIEGMSALKISEKLNQLGVLSPLAYKRDRGLPHPTGGFADKPETKWSATAIFRILKDETYTGTLIQGRQGTLNYKINNVIDKPKSEWIRTENAHDAIISKQDFELAQRLLRIDTRTSPGGDTVYLFSGLLICGCCGSRMTRKTNYYKKRAYHYYYCQTGKKNGCTSAPMIREEDLIDCVLQNIKSYLFNIASLEEALAGGERKKTLKLLGQKYRQQIDENKYQLAQVSTFKSSLYENLVNCNLTKDEYKMLKAKYAEDAERLSNAISVLETEHADVVSGKSERLQLARDYKEFESLLAVDRRMVVTFIKSIRVVSKTHLEVSFNFQDDYEKESAIEKLASTLAEVE